jgi:hypothetical protein
MTQIRAVSRVRTAPSDEITKPALAHFLCGRLLTFAETSIHSFEAASIRSFSFGSNWCFQRSSFVSRTDLRAGGRLE